MEKIYKLGIVRYVDRKRTIIWGGEHPSVSECLRANEQFIAKNLGREFIVQGFTKVVGHPK